MPENDELRIGISMELTKREWFAGMALQGAMSSLDLTQWRNQYDAEKHVASVSRRFADALIAELEKSDG